MPKIALLLEDIRSANNVGAIFRGAVGLGVDEIVLCGYTPYPQSANDSRLPHIARRNDTKIAKTALGAQNIVTWRHQENISDSIHRFKKLAYVVAALQQTPDAVDIGAFKTPAKLALVVGNELTGVSPEALELCDSRLEIPMSVRHRSFNVAVAAAIAIYQLTRQT